MVLSALSAEPEAGCLDASEEPPAALSGVVSVGALAVDSVVAVAEAGVAVVDVAVGFGRGTAKHESLDDKVSLAEELAASPFCPFRSSVSCVPSVFPASVAVTPLAVEPSCAGG